MPENAVARAWGLKAECYEAWHREPRRTREAADAVAALASAQGAVELDALARWTDGIALMAEGRLADALARLAAAEAAFASIGDEQHAAEAQVPQMAALSWLGREDEVVALGQRALVRFEACGDARSAAKVEINLGTSWSRRDRHAEAEQAYRRAAGRGEQLDDPYLAAMAGIGLANALTWQFRSDAALQAAARARRLARAGGHAILQAQTWEAAGQVELNRGRWAAALAALARALKLLEAAGAAPQRRLECETALADAYAAVRLHDESIGLYRRIVETAASLAAANEEAYARLQLGRELGRCGQAAAALESLAAARAIYGQLGNAAAIAHADLILAQLQLADAQAEGAGQAARRAADALQAAGLRGLALEARVLDAQACARCGDVHAARGLFEATLQAAGDLGHIAGACRAGLAELALQAGELVLARDHARQALQRLDALREALPADELRAAIGTDARVLHEILVAVALADGPAAVSQDAAADAAMDAAMDARADDRIADPFDEPIAGAACADPGARPAVVAACRPDAQAATLWAEIERGRARALAQGMAPQQTRRDARALSARLLQLRQAWREAMADDDATRLPVLDADIVAVESALLEGQRRELLVGRGGRMRAVSGPGPRVPAEASLEACQAALGPGRAMVAFHVQRGELLTLVATDRTLRVERQPAGPLAERVAGLRLQVEAARHPALARRHGALLAERLRAHASALYQHLWAPVQRLAGGREDVVVLPHGPLHDLPWAMLHDGSHWLVERCRLTLAPSASIWAGLQARARGARPAQVVAVGADGPGLAHVAREVDAVAAVHGASTVVLKGAEATAAAVRTAAAGGADLLHLACHARFRADNPAFSTLHLADGPLPMHEIARWRLEASLVVLSACETGVSRIAPGDEAFGLVRAVMLAGARSVIASHWAVSDRATADLLQAVHERLRDGAAPGEALQRAQADAAAGGEHPYHWAAFAVHGGG